MVDDLQLKEDKVLTKTEAEWLPSDGANPATALKELINKCLRESVQPLFERFKFTLEVEKFTVTCRSSLISLLETNEMEKNFVSTIIIPNTRLSGNEKVYDRTRPLPPNP